MTDRGLMRWFGILCLLCSATATASLAADAPARPFVHPLFGNDMVLQRDARDPIWGWTDPGTLVTVTFNGKSATATAGPDGKWLARIGPFEAGGPYELTISGPREVKLTNVLVGDVWVCSGQSNMEMGIANGKDAQQEIAAADHPQLRLFTVPKQIAYQPQSGFRTEPPTGEEARWLVCSPQNVRVGDWGGFSAVAYFFGRDLQKELNVPIGLIHTSWGGTIAEAWTSAEALKQMPDFKDAVESLQDPQPEPGKEKLSNAERMQRWYAMHDPGSRHELGWADPALDDADWKQMKLPQYWERAGVGLDDFDGIVWFRKEVAVPDSWDGKDLMLHLGPVDDRDTTWVNGTRVGGRDLFTEPRDYKIPGSAVKDGKLVIAVRVLDTGGGGGIYGQPKDMRLEAPGANAMPISLAGEWKYKVSTPLSKSGNPPPSPEEARNNPNVPTVLYNGMIGPLLPAAVRGAIWYQGESNANRAMQYRTLLATMIRDWRSRFTTIDALSAGPGASSPGQGFPFFIVQLAAFMPESAEPRESQWAELREAQDVAARAVGNSAIAVANDIGEANDIHPHNKQEVGRRLALDALALAYGKPIEYSGPTFQSMDVNGSRVTLRFDHLGGGLEAKGGPLGGFAIAGEDKKFHWADARVEGDTVVLESAQAPNPTAVRYAWANNPTKANLYNKAGLPAPPFRTDMPK